MKKVLLLVFSVTLVLFFNPKAFAQQGKRVKAANNLELKMALSNPNVSSVEITQAGFYDELLFNAAAGTIVVKGDGSRATCTYWIQPKNVCFDTTLYPGPTPGFVVDTAKAGTIGGQPDCPPDNAGYWQVLVKPVGSTVNFLAASNMHTMPFEADMPGQYQLEYRWDAFTAVQTDYYFYDVPVITQLDANPDTVCGLSTSITFDYDFGFTAPDTIVTWMVNGADSSAIYPKAPGTFTFTAPSCGAYQVILTVTDSLFCDPSADTLNLYFYDDPVADAGMDDSVCGLVYDGLNGTYTGATCDAGTLPDTSWSMFSGPGTASFSAGMDSVTVTVCGAYEFVYTVTNGLCDDSDTVAVYFYDTPVVDAGTPDTVHVCGLKADLNGSYTVDCDNGITPTDTWTGDGIFYANDSVEVTVCGIYTFYYTVDNGLCSATDSIVYMFHDTPLVDAGTDADVCGLTYDLTPAYTVDCNNGSVVTTTWDQATGPGTATFNGNTVTVDVCGTYEFTYTVVNGPCSTTDTIQVKFYDTPVVDAGANADVCGLTYTLMPGYTVNCANGGTVATAWTMVSGPLGGTSTFTGNDVTVSDCGIYTFQYKVTNGPCADSAEVIISFFDTPVVDAGADDDICGLSYVLTPGYTIDCDNGGTIATAWSLVSGPGTAGFTGNDVLVDTCGIYTFQYKVTNGPCSDSATVTISFFDTPVVDAGADDTVCGLTYDLMPNYTVNCSNGGTVGTVWTKNSGPGVVIFSGDNVTVDTCGLYTFYYTVTNGPCTEVDSVDIFFTIPPEFWTQGVPDKVCGFVSPEFYVGLNQSCQTGSGSSSVTTNADTVVYQGQDGWIAYVDTCGLYWITFAFNNGYCTVDSTIWIEFYETPDPQIIGDDTVFTCSTVDYTVTDLGSCNPLDSLEFKWHVTGGIFTGGVITPTGANVSVDWDNVPGGGQLIVEVNIKGLPECSSADTLNIVKELPTFEGQVKYWNAFETYMPTPFSTELYSSYPFDYFYVTLYHVGLQGLDSLTTVYVQPRLMEDLNELMSYFDFGTIDTWELGCDAEYVLKVWDGGLIYHTTPPPPAEETIIGASYTYNNWGGVNATDALAIQLMVGGSNNINGAPWNYSWVGLNTDSPWYGYYSHGIADVNSSNTYTNGGITALDALTAKYRAVGLLGSYPHNGAGNNQFTPNFRVTGRMVDSLPQMTFPTPFDYDNVDDVPFTHSGTDYMYFSQATDHKYTSALIPWGGEKNYINLYYESIGDINASYVPPGPGLKAEPTVSLTYEGVLGAQIGDELTIPVSIDRDAEIGAITLSFNYRNDLIEVLGTNYTEDDIFINQEEGVLNIAWFSTEALDLVADASVAQIRVRILAEMPENTELFELNANTELADASANPIDIDLKTSGVTTDKGLISGADLTASNYPNPFNNTTTISYVLPETGKVKVDVYNNVGMLVTTLVDQVQESGVQNVIFNKTGSIKPGIYFYHITVQGEMNNYSAVKRMIVVN